MNFGHKSMLLKIEIPPMGKARPRFGGKHVHMPKNYMLWKKKFALIAKSQADGRFTGSFAIDIQIFKKSGKMRSDIDNVAGSILDALQDCGIIKNDRDCWRLNILLRKSDRDIMFIYLDSPEKYYVSASDLI